MRFSILIIFILLIFKGFGQYTVDKPNFGTNTHYTLSIDKIEFTTDKTVVYMRIVNMSEHGDQFCADKNIYLQPSWLKNTFELTHSENIPVCPDTHQFYSVGEELSFKLYFPAIDTSYRYIDIVENCSDACFQIRGVILDKKFNDEVNLAYKRYERGDLKLAALSFENTIKWFPDYPFGFAYFHLINMYAELQNWEKAKFWYGKLAGSSTIFDSRALIDELKKKDFYQRIE